MSCVSPQITIYKDNAIIKRELNILTCAVPTPVPLYLAEFEQHQEHDVSEYIVHGQHTPASWRRQRNYIQHVYHFELAVDNAYKLNARRGLQQHSRKKYQLLGQNPTIYMHNVNVRDFYMQNVNVHDIYMQNVNVRNIYIMWKLAIFICTM